MFRAIGYLILIWGLANFLPTAFTALERAATESFKLVEAAAIASQKEIQSLE